jgi:riboflavin synthase
MERLHKRIRRSTSTLMFTGLVEEKGLVSARRATGGGVVLCIETRFEKLALGESIAVDGACLTVARVTAGGFEADVSNETLARTTLGELVVGARVNLERSLALGARLGGHIVTGHVDGTCTLAARAPLGDASALTFRFDPRLSGFIAEKGSVAVNGVSLTVNAAGKDTFEVAIIPHTREKTTLGDLAVGSAANLEVDLLARYLARLLSARASSADDAREVSARSDAAWLERLARAGFV